MSPRTNSSPGLPGACRTTPSPQACSVMPSSSGPSTSGAGAYRCPAQAHGDRSLVRVAGQELLQRGPAVDVLRPDVHRAATALSGGLRGVSSTRPENGGTQLDAVALPPATVSTASGQAQVRGPSGGWGA